MNSSQQHAFEASQEAVLGDILRSTKGLSGEDVQKALTYQRQHGVRFGDAAVALGLVQHEDVVWALAQQFRYPYTPLNDSTFSDELIVAKSPFSDEAEAFRDLRSQLVLADKQHGAQRRALAIVSAGAQDGKTLLAANLATVFSQLPCKTLLIDANLRSPRLHHIFGVAQVPGLSSVLAGRSEVRLVRPIEHLPNLFLLPAGVGAPNPSELLQRDTFALVLNDLLSQFDRVLVDTPSGSMGSDARIIAAQCGSALVLGRKGWSPTRALQALVGQLNKNAVKINGVVINEH
ncbi:MAG: polysaccharide biosynthesis tyrosine autokinase [Aquabacterium sp.]